MHPENVIISGKQPIPIDVEVALQPQTRLDNLDCFNAADGCFALQARGKLQHFFLQDISGEYDLNADYLEKNTWLVADANTQTIRQHPLDKEKFMEGFFQVIGALRNNIDKFSEWLKNE